MQCKHTLDVLIALKGAIARALELSVDDNLTGSNSQSIKTSGANLHIHSFLNTLQAP